MLLLIASRALLDRGHLLIFEYSTLWLPLNSLCPSMPVTADMSRSKREYMTRILERYSLASSLLWCFEHQVVCIPLQQLCTKGLQWLTLEKLDKPYSIVVNYIWCKLSFSLLHSTISWLRDTWTTYPAGSTDTNIDLTLAQGRVVNY